MSELIHIRLAREWNFQGFLSHGRIALDRFRNNAGCISTSYFLANRCNLNVALIVILIIIALIQPINWPSKPIILALLKSSKRGAKTRFLLSKFTFRHNRFVHSIANIKKSRGKLQRAYQQNHTEFKNISSEANVLWSFFNRCQCKAALHLFLILQSLKDIPKSYLTDQCAHTQKRTRNPRCGFFSEFEW